MNEKSLQHEIGRTFRAYGGDALKSNDAAYIQAVTGQEFVPAAPEPAELLKPVKGRADFFAFIAPYFFAIEAKYAAANFNFSEVRLEQRLWLSEHWDVAWLWLSMGRRPGAAGGRETWLIPWPDYQRIEESLKWGEAQLRGLAHRQPHKREHRALGLSAHEQFADYALQWQGGGVWTIPAAHTFWSFPRSIVDAFSPLAFQGQPRRQTPAPLPA